MPRPLATNSSWVATSRTWLMLPGADGKRDEKTVCTESITSAARLQALDLLEDALERGLGHQVEPAALDAEPLAAQLDLALRLLARDVEHAAVGAAEQVRHLQQQRALADPRLAADQHQRARHDPAPEHAVELVDARGDARLLGVVDRVEGLRARRRLAHELRVGTALARGRRRLLALLDEAVPLAAVGAAPEPLRALEPAGLAGEEDPGFRQAAPPRHSRFSKRVNSLMNASLREPVGPLRCLPMMISAMPRFSSSACAPPRGR